MAQKLAQIWRQVIRGFARTPLILTLRKDVKNLVVKLAKKVYFIFGIQIILSRLIFFLFLQFQQLFKHIFNCCRLNLQWQHVEIGDDMIILQDMDSDDDMNKNGRELTAGQLTTKKIIKNIKNVNLKIYFWIRLNW